MIYSSIPRNGYVNTPYIRMSLIVCFKVYSSKILHDAIKCKHQGVLHVVFDFSDELYAIKEKIFKQSLTDISLVRAELSLYILQELFLFQRLTVIHVSKGKHEIENLAFIIDYQMQFEPEKPSH